MQAKQEHRSHVGTRKPNMKFQVAFKKADIS